MPKPNPLQDANFCSQLFSCWLNPLFKIGHKRKLKQDDMYSVLPEDRSQYLGEELQWHWDREVERAQRDAREPSLTKAIMKCYWSSYVVWGIFTFLEEGTRVVQPMFLGKMISYVENYDPNDSAALHEAYGYAAGLSACVLVWAVLHHLYFYHMQRVGMRLRVAVCHMIYRKSLCLSSSAMGKTTTGQIVNLLSNDVNRFDQHEVRLLLNFRVEYDLVFAVEKPQPIREVTMFLHYLWVGPLQAIAVTALLWMEIGMSCLAGMAVLIILLLLQSCFGKLFSSLRSKTAALTDDRISTMSEVISGIKTIKMNAWEKSFIDLISRLRRKEISEILKSSYLRGMNLASFFAVSKIMIFVTFITNDLLDNRITASQVFVVVMLFEALRFSSTLYFPMAVENVSEAVVSIQRIENFLLLDEIPQLNPQLASDGETIVDMNNFTASWDKKSGTPTLQDLFFTARPGELLAVVGPVGAGKSSLLRAVLGELPPSQGQVIVHGRIAYVPQQPWVFSGTVRSNILFGKKYEEDRYEEVIKACALEEDLQFLEDGDQTLIGDRGTPLSEGQKARVSLARAVYQDADIYLLDDPFSAVDAGVSRHLFEQCICQALREKITILVTHQWQYLKAASWILILKGGTIVQCGTYIGLLESGVDFDFLLKRNEEEPSPDLESSTLKNQSRPLMRGASPELQNTENIEVTLPLEDHLEGKVGIKTYNDYFTAGAQWFSLIFLILVNIAAQVAYVLQDWWLAYWANLQSALNFGAYGRGETVVMLDLNWYLGTYSGLTVSTILFGITRSLMLFYVLVNSSQTLHNKMLWSILRAPVLFFYRNPIGRILNRFSKDIGHMDDLLPLIFQDFIQTFLLVVGVVGVMVAAIPWTAIPVIPLGIIFFVLQWYFLRTSREVKRLECTTRSPVFSHVASSLRGLWTIRAYKAEQRFQELFNAYQDLHSDVICAIFATVVAFGALILVENLSSYTSTLSCHPPALPPQTTFFSTDLILTGLGELLREPEHSPKSTPAGAMGDMSLLVAHCPVPSAFISRSLDLTLRQEGKKEPVLFTGTMRKNLDPYNEYLEEELWNVLEEVQLKEVIKALPSGLDTELAESGLNLSVGQRQLVCLARTVLRKNQILILDKATSNVDPSLPFLSSLKYINFSDFRTDELIQKKIHEKFTQCTVLTITHRLSTVIDCEWILVLDSGRLKEYTQTYDLLQNTDSLFHKMVQKLGKAEASALTERAKQKKVYCHQDKSGIHNTLTLYSEWCLKMRWINPFFLFGHKWRLKENEIHSVHPEDCSQHLGEELQGYWKQEVERAEKNGQKPSLKKAIIKCYWKSCLLSAIFIFFEALRLSNSAMRKTTTGQIVNLLSNDVKRFDQCFNYQCPKGKINLNYVFIKPHSPSGICNRSKTAALTDNRIKTMSEVITGIRTIKMYAWEKSFTDFITRLRRNEISKILKSSYLRGTNLAIFFAASKIMIFITFIIAVVLDNPITASQVFLVVMLFETVRFTGTLYFPMAIEKVSEAVVSINRIKDFLLLEEILPHDHQLVPSDGETIVDVQDLTAFWDKESGTPALQGLSFTVRRGELLAVVGPVGAGKSSLLSALLREMPLIQGNVNIHGRIAYVSQQPWVFPGTVRSNILFGKKYEEDRYKEVIKACALEKHLQNLKEGDKTVIGDGGTPLSEGQKTRVSLARAVYQDADIYLLDDPLSAVDVEVSRHLFEQCICQALKDKITILVTHQLQYLKAASEIVTLENGEMVQKGPYTEFLLKSGIDSGSLSKKTEESEPSFKSPDQPQESSTLPVEDVAPEDHDTEDILVILPLEDYSKRQVGCKTCKNYFTAGAHWFIIIFLILMNIAAQVAYILQDWWLLDWANEHDINVSRQGNETKMIDLNWYLVVYSGRILNRFCKDIGRMDDLLPLTFQDLIQTFLLVIGVVIVMVAMIPWTAIPLALLGIIFFLLQLYFLNTSGNVKGLECAKQSPVFSHLASSLQGLRTIRAYKAEQKFQKLFEKCQDLHSESWFMLLTMSQCFAMCLDVVCAVLVIVVAVGALILQESWTPGQIGLVLSLTLTLMRMFQWCVRQSTEVENMMMSAERVIEYTELEKEGPWELDFRPPVYWPDSGIIAFNNVNFKYSPDGPLVLKDLTVSTESKEKVCIVGKTGAGKSSLIAALFRFSDFQGTISIDKNLTTSMGLYDLRKKMSVVPQEPVLFIGTMKENLDPFNDHKEEDLWNALEEVQLKETIQGLPGKMETELAESGSNLSVGQRQLLCLARALLRKNKILIMDEATSNVDPRTDGLIRKIIHGTFVQCTVVTITNRLSSVVDSDRIMVLDSGKLEEYDKPHVLLHNKNSLFYKMVQHLGETEANALIEKAKQAHFKRK
ncbi:hypothetical protein MJT46_009677 [Ovis ammon polii x Ovis aries]|nr:hypothetical protein MJT46_009677 [Ovis ammon polii x Ovis aries]